MGFSRNNIKVCNFPISISKNFDVTNEKIEKRIIAVGRFSDPRKNINMLLNVFEKLYQNDNFFKLHIIGMKPSYNILKEFENLESFKNIIFVGAVDPNKLHFWYSKSDVMLITSYQEGFGIVGLEAFSYGIPVVATDCGGTRDYIIDGKNGYLIKINDVDDMVNKTLKIFSSKELYYSMRHYALRLIKENFSENKIFSIFKSGLINVYPELNQFFKQKDDTKRIKKSNNLKQLFMDQSLGEGLF